MLEHVTRPADELDQMNSHKIVTPENYLELFLFRDDGMTRTFRSRHPTSTNSRRIDCYLAVRYLDNLGVLDRSISANRKYLEHGDYAAGFMYSYYLTYSEHQMMHRECVETREWKKADELSRMAYMLLPDTSIPDAPLRAIGKTTIHTSNLTLIRPYLFAPEVYSQRTAWQKHDFLIGQRRLDDTILRWWPDYINSSSELKRQVDLAASTRSGGSRLTPDGNGFRFVNRRYLKGQSLVFAGVSTASQDLRVEMLLKLFPFVLLALALICLFLFADLLAAMFINPVAGFRSATAEIADGNYQVAVKIAATDEFSSLAAAFNRMATGLAQREKMRRFVSENLFERIEQSSSDNAGASEVTLLASDIRSFTTLSEKHEPQQIVSLLNDYFTEMECAIKESGGLIERFVGDAVVAVFYNDQIEKPEHRAVQAAVRMRARLAGLNRQRTAAGLFNFDNGIGIATGEAVSGIAGSSAGRQIFSVIGEVTGLAEKLESASRNVASRILICPKTAAGLADRRDISEVTGQFGFAAFTIVADEVLNG
jgi:class 3 adenylate cyclase